MSTEILLPKLGLTMDEAKVVTWLKNIGDYVNTEDTILEVETDKANLEVESPGEGYLVEQNVEPGDVVAVGKVLAILSETNDIPLKDTTNAKNVGITESEQTEEVLSNEIKQVNNKISKENNQNPFLDGERIRVSPAARKFAKEKGIEVANLVGSGPRGRIVLSDVREAEGKIKENVLEKQSVEQNVIAKNANDKIVSLSSMRKIIARRMTESFKNVPQFNLKREVDCTAIDQTRKSLNTINNSTVKLSLNDFIIQAVAKALQQHPAVNASYIEEGNDFYIIEKADINIGLAVALEDGLVVPVIKNVEKLNLTEIAHKRAELINKAKAGKLRPEEMNNGTFTISNLGGFNIDEFTAIVNPPETGILAVGRAKDVPIVNDEKEIEIKPLMHISGSFDHRTIDGAEGARFINTVVDQLHSTKWNLI